MQKNKDKDKNKDKQEQARTSGNMQGNTASGRNCIKDSRGAKYA